MTEPITLNKEGDLYDYFRQTPDYIFIDDIEVVPGERAVASKRLSEDTWYFKSHFPGNPMMPGVFQMEAMMQAGGLILNTLPGKKELRLYFSESKSVKMYAGVHPGDTLTVDVVLKRYGRGVAWFDAEARVGDKCTSKMTFSLIAPDEVQQIMGGGGSR